MTKKQGLKARASAVRRVGAAAKVAIVDFHPEVTHLGA